LGNRRFGRGETSDKNAQPEVYCGNDQSEPDPVALLVLKQTFGLK
jgi:hypothetical protein